MARTSKHDMVVQNLRNELKALHYSNAATVEQAVANEQRVCDVFGMRPSEPGTYDYCPVHSTVRFNGHCAECD